MGEMLREMFSGLSLPVTDPVWIFFIVMVIILFAPVIMGKLRIPHIIGMIVAGIIVGEHGLNILERDSSFELFGKVGLFYIMFLAGLEMDMEDFRKNKVKGLVFGLLTFAVPMVFGVWSGMSLLGYSFVSSVLLASMYASHTLLAYPIVSRYGLSRQRSVTITIGGTAVTVTLALFILAVVGGMYKGTADGIYWVMLVVKVVVLSLLIVFLLPRLGRWFFRKYDDAVMHYVFVLAMVFLGGGLMALVGMEGILGAFLVGLVLNPLIPRVSPLMSRIEFVGNALFIPYFLIGVGMIIDLRTLFGHGQALKVAAVMTVVATATKWIAAFLTQKIYGMSRNERGMMFGLSNAQAVATLAAVLVGYNIILDNGQRLLDEDVLNGTVVMILFTCIISSVVTEKYARKFALEGDYGDVSQVWSSEHKQRILIPVANPDTIAGLVCFAMLLKRSKGASELMALSVTTDSQQGSDGMASGKRLLEKAAQIASAADVKVTTVSRYDINVPSGIIHTVKEYDVTDLVIGLHRKGGFLDSFFGNLTNNLLKGTGREVIVTRFMVPVNTVKNIVAVVPANAEYETGFSRWTAQLCHVSGELGCPIVFRALEETAAHLRQLCSEHTLAKVEISRRQPLSDRLDFRIGQDELLVIVSARADSISYDPGFERLPAFIYRNFAESSFLILYPEQVVSVDTQTFTEPISH